MRLINMGTLGPASCLGLALLVQTHPRPVSLKWKPLAHPVLNYEAHRGGQYGAITGDVRMTVTRKIIGVERDGTIAVEESTYAISEVAAGKEQISEKRDGHRASWKLKRKPNGELAAFDDASWGIDWPDQSAGAEPLFDMIYPDKPVRKGDQWTYLREPNEAKRVTLRRIIYRFEGTEQVRGRPCYRVTAKLSGMLGGGVAGGKVTGAGTFWLSVDDGTIVKSDLSISKPDLAPIILHETITRKE